MAYTERAGHSVAGIDPLNEGAMQHWLRRIRGAIGMGLTWTVAWAVTGLLIGVTSILLPGLPWHYIFDIFDAPLPALAVPGFFGGVFFSLVLGTAMQRRRLSEISLPRIAAWGALGGLILSLFPATLVLVGLANVEGGVLGIWQLTAVLSVPLTLLSAASATATLALARTGQVPGSLEAAAAEDRIGPGPTDR